MTEMVDLKPMETEEHKRAEELLSRTQDMEAEIYECERQLAEANRQRLESLGRLAGGIAHDFGNLLGVILGYSQLVIEQISDEQVRKQLREIEQAATSAAGLTRQLLAFSRQQVLEPKVVSPNQIVLNIEGLVRRLIGEHIQFETHLASDLGRVKADPGQIEQVVMNLAINARDAMIEGGKLLIETRNVELDELYAQAFAGVTPGAYVGIAVTDTGSGISPEVQAHIFEPFFTTKGRGRGTGLGLATVHGIVKQSGGHISVYSELGHGTSFKVYLPRVNDPVVADSRLPVAKPKRATETVLVVEDDPALRKLFRIMLSQDGLRVLTAARPSEALASLESHDGDLHLLMTDVVLPEMNGPVLAGKLKKRYPQVRVLFVSAFTEDIVVDSRELEPGTGFLQKPFSPQELSGKIQELLS